MIGTSREKQEFMVGIYVSVEKALKVLYLHFLMKKH